MAKGHQGTDGGPVFGEYLLTCVILAFDGGYHILSLGEYSGVGGVVSGVCWEKPCVMGRGLRPVTEGSQATTQGRGAQCLPDTQYTREYKRRNKNTRVGKIEYEV